MTTTKYTKAGKVYEMTNIVTVESDLHAHRRITSFELSGADSVRYFEFEHDASDTNFDQELSFEGFEREAEVVRIKTRKDDGIHITNGGDRIAITDLTDEHLLNILSSVRFSTRGYQYREEAELRGLIPTTSERAAKITELRAVLASKSKETLTAVLTDRTPGKRFYQVFSGLPGETHRYYVTIADNDDNKCVCPGFHYSGRCKHVRAALESDEAKFGTQKRGEQNERAAA